MPELATFVKFKVMEPESVQTFLDSLSFSKEEMSEQEYYFSFRKAVIENFIFNLKGEISESLRLMSRKAAEACLDAMYTGAVMLNPGLDVDAWISLSYMPTGSSFNDDPIDFDSLSKDFIESLKKGGNKRAPKFDLDDFPFASSKRKEEPKKPKQISKQKFMGLENHLKQNIIGQDAAIDTIVSALKRAQAGLSDADRPLGVFLFAGSSRSW
jgi:ATP-dependent Clp protease ATP-binding subunit ClpA